MRHYYLILLALLTIVSLAAMAATYEYVTTLPSASEPLAAGIFLAFEGFVFGGLFQFLLEGRREQYKDRMDRIQRYHQKLKKHVIDFWSTREAEPRNALGSLPQSRENLYVFLDLNSNANPDSRYLNDTLTHLKAKRYSGMREERDRMEVAMKDHNSKVSILCESTANLIERIKTIGYEEQNISTLDSPPVGSFNVAAVYEFLDVRYAASGKETLRPQDATPPPTILALRREGPLMLSFQDPWLNWKRVARNEDSPKVEQLSKLLEGFAPTYTASRREIEMSFDSIRKALKNFKDRALTVGYDIEDEDLEGNCSFEVRMSE